MSSTPFQFKQFFVHQDRTAMKVGTDGVLLGAWVNIDSRVENILDIGTGTGLLALQAAQRCEAEIIDALEIDEQAFEQAVDNFENSPWSDRLFCYHASFQEFVKEIDETYDLIVSNPPFYTNGYKEMEDKRAMARHNIGLNFKDLLEGITKLLSPTGSAALIIPFSEEENFIKLARETGLFPSRVTRVKGNPNRPAKRSLIQLNRITFEPVINELVIEIERHVFTREYSDLVKDFYLKL